MGRLAIKLVNVQGLTVAKTIELAPLLESGGSENDIVIMGLVETHEKFKKVDWGDKILTVSQMRDRDDKKGGGILLLCNNRDISIEKKEYGNNDLLVVDIKVGSFAFTMMVTYMDVSDRFRNIELYRIMDGVMEEAGNRKVLILGDFNGHVDFIGNHRTNGNGNLMLDFIDRSNLVMLNNDLCCEGLYTRVQNEERTVIDYGLVNQELYGSFVKMYIDEDKLKFDLSDHCLLEVEFAITNRTNQEAHDRKLVEYYKVNDDRLKRDFISKVLVDINREINIDIQGIEKIIMSNANTVLKRKYVVCKKGEGQQEPVWLTREIKSEIRKRREYNRMKRRGSPEERDRYWILYRHQKEKGKLMVAESKANYERVLAESIRNGKHAGKKMWMLIDKLKGNDRESKKLDLYREDGSKVEREGEVVQEMLNFWRKIYKCRENGAKELWNPDRKKQYERETQVWQIDSGRLSIVMEVGEVGTGWFGNTRIVTYRLREEVQTFPREIREHMDMLKGKISEEPISQMGRIKFNEKEIQTILGSLKLNKATGPDGIKAEFYKWMKNEMVFVRALAQAWEAMLGRGTVPENWKTSKTVMIPKNNKPTAKDHRPIALLNVGYKVFMAAAKKKIVEHLAVNHLEQELQAGFSEGRRIEENLFLLKYCIDQSYIDRKKLVVVAIDFQKAFDSVDRSALIQALIDCRCDGQLIDIMVDIYNGDWTDIHRNGRSLGSMEVTSGIRQGCSGSPQLFVMVVNKIINSVKNRGLGYRSKSFYIPVLFYADDGLILAETLAEAEQMVEIVMQIAGEQGLSINRSKSEALIFNDKDSRTVDNIWGIAVVDNIRYLGVIVESKRNCFGKHKREKLKLAKKMVNMTYSVIVRACSRLIIGKTYWKSVVLPSILYASAVIGWSPDDLLKLQRLENSVWRQILAAPSYAPAVALQGEVGCSTMAVRDAKTKLMFARYLGGSRNGLAREVYREMMDMEVQVGWVRTVKKYMAQYESTQIMDMEFRGIKSKIEQIAGMRWKEEVEAKSTLTLYRWKEKICEENFYNNSRASSLMFKCRSNSLQLGWRNRFRGGNVECNMCGGGVETLEHFLLECERLEGVRERFGTGEVLDLKKLLLFDKATKDETAQYMRLVLELWMERERLAAGGQDGRI